MSKHTLKCYQHTSVSLVRCCQGRAKGWSGLNYLGKIKQFQQMFIWGAIAQNELLVFFSGLQTHRTYVIVSLLLRPKKIHLHPHWSEPCQSSSANEQRSLFWSGVEFSCLVQTRVLESCLTCQTKRTIRRNQATARVCLWEMLANQRWSWFSID